MRKPILLLLFILPYLAIAQQNEGVVYYKETITWEAPNRPDMPEHVKEMLKNMPREHSFQKQLVFTPEESMFKAWEDPNVPVELEEERGPMRMMRFQNEQETYVNYTEQRLVQQRDMFGKVFLIKDSLDKAEWKITGQQKEILGHNCMQATAMIDSNAVEAWFCPTIPVFGGPEGLSNLPGLVLEASMRDGKMIAVAERIEFRTVEKGEIEEPQKGKEVTREEFREIMRAKREEMREMRQQGGGGHRMMMGH